MKKTLGKKNPIFVTLIYIINSVPVCTKRMEEKSMLGRPRLVQQQAKKKKKLSENQERDTPSLIIVHKNVKLSIFCSANLFFFLSSLFWFCTCRLFGSLKIWFIFLKYEPTLCNKYISMLLAKCRYPQIYFFFASPKFVWSAIKIMLFIIIKSSNISDLNN